MAGAVLSGGLQRANDRGGAQAPGARSAEAGLRYTVEERVGERLHLLTIPNTPALAIVPVVSNPLRPLEAVARARRALAGINGGYFDPANQKTNAWVLAGGQVLANPRDNRRLMRNPALGPYLEAILNRSEFRLYQCQGHRRNAIVPHRSAVPPGCRLELALGGGPQLLPVMTTEREAFTAHERGVLVRDAIDAFGPNARTALGIKADGQLLWVMVEQRPGRARSGLTLGELAQFLHQHGVRSALNLDGGSSSSLYFKGESHLGKHEADGAPVSRSVHSVLLVVPTPHDQRPPR
ncbi:phosphodiester glycosidase family protein [Cyanobium sp. Morenito 9A2]|uniref:phosphodiester glycosidase family protein n=1 Tax=Cyanobium sp. Morenito 9A2 TaxID=2823718 RepID=UPI0020CDC469|nr:phosphodiester glycosidase family protein [Cyanobium sp. Morenito 9A2]MCP9850437.1 phosphodiester glycosidase family protein [Cyanobium sp. Morenito 9A2]